LKDISGLEEEQVFSEDAFFACLDREGEEYFGRGGLIVVDIAGLLA